MTLVELVRAILARLKPAPKPVPKPVPPPVKPPVQPPVIPFPPITSAPAPVNSAATKLGITIQPSNTATTGVALVQQPVIQVQNAGGSPVNQAGIAVTAAIGSGSGTLSGTTTVNTDASGVATFTNLVITGASTNTLTFTASGLTAVTSNTIVVSAATATKLGITTQPSSTATTGVALSQQPVIQLLTAGGSPVSQSGVAVLAQIGTGTGTLSGTTTINTNGSGVATFTDLVLTGASTNTLLFTAVAAGLTSVTSNSIVVSAAGSFGILQTWASSTLNSAGIEMGATGTWGAQFANQTPGHCAVINNPTGQAPWTTVTTGKVAQHTFDSNTDANAFFTIDPSAFVNMGYGGHDLYAGMWVYLNTDEHITNGEIRKYQYWRWNYTGSSGNPDSVGNSSGDVWNGETDTLSDSQLWSHDGVGPINTGQWYFYEIRMRTPLTQGASNGQGQLWINGISIILNTTLSYSNTASWVLNYIGFGYQSENNVGVSHRYLGPLAISLSRITTL